MERKIGEIFEYNGEWYQCLKSASCDECAFLNSNCIDNPSLKCSVDDRTDNCAAIFKKLEKWGGSYPNADKLYQLYRLPMNIEKLPPHTEGINLVRFDIVEIEIKQNKEDMEDLDKIKVRDYTKVKELNVMEENKLNLKPFDIQKAREGKPVCTRDGRKARIICFDRKFYHDGYNYPIVAMVNDNDNELVHAYTQDGLLVGNMEGDLDLMMLPEKKDGWVNVAKEPLGDDEVVLGYIFNSYEDAVRSGKANERYVATVRIEWEG